MPRRTSLPGADLLFGGGTDARPAKDQEPVPRRVRAEDASDRAAVAAPPVVPSPDRQGAPGPVGPSEARQPEKHSKPTRPAPGKAAPATTGSARPRHEEKITIYCTDSDLTRLEAARLDLRANHRLASDRGRIVRAALAEILDDFDARGADSALVKRLSSQ